jgi:hypothetical protein
LAASVNSSIVYAFLTFPVLESTIGIPLPPE